MCTRQTTTTHVRDNGVTLVFRHEVLHFGWLGILEAVPTDEVVCHLVLLRIARLPVGVGRLRRHAVRRCRYLGHREEV